MSKFSDQTNYNCRITLDNGEEYNVFSSWIHNEGLDRWKDWHCDVGSTRLFVDYDLTVYSGECKNDNLGNIDTFNLKEDTVCKYDYCSGCTADVACNKSKD